MKNKLFKTLSLIMFGGFLSLSALAGIENKNPLIETKAEQLTGSVDLNNKTAVEGWSKNHTSDYCGCCYGAKFSQTIVKNNAIADFSVFQNATGTIKVKISGFTNSGTNSFTVQLINSDGNELGNPQTITNKLGSGSGPSNAKTSDWITFTGTKSTSGLSITMEQKGVLTKVEWQIDYEVGNVTEDESGGTQTGGGSETGNQEDNPLFTTGKQYVLINNEAALNAGDKIVFGSQANNAVNGTKSTNGEYIMNANAAFKDNTLYTLEGKEIVLGGSSNAWTFSLENEYIGTSSNKFNFSSNVSTWQIAFDGDLASVTSNGSNPIQFNSGSPRFKTYALETTNCSLIEIYKLANDESFTLEYNANGGAGEMIDSNSPYKSSTSATVLNCSFDAPNGKTFDHWNTKSDDSGTSYNPNSSILMNENKTLYAIWKDSYIPSGDEFTLVTNANTLQAGDIVLLTYVSGQKVEVNGKLDKTYSSYLSAYSANIENGCLYYTNENIAPLTLGGSKDNWTLTYGSTTIAADAANSNTLCTSTRSNSNKFWSISISDEYATITNKGGFGSLYYNAQSPRFSNYTSSGQSPIKIYRKSGIAKEVTLVKDEFTSNIGTEVTISIKECLGFEANSYQWDYVDDANSFVLLKSGQGTNEATYTLNAEGVAKVMVTVNGEYKATATINVTNYTHTLLSKSDYFIAGPNGTGILGISDGQIINKDIFDESTDLWHFEEAFVADESYYLKAGNKYLSFEKDVTGGTNNVSRLCLTDDIYNAWIVAQNGQNYQISTVTQRYGTRYLAQNSNDNKWYAFDSVNSVSLLSAGVFTGFRVGQMPTKTIYDVGDNFVPTNAKIFAQYDNGYEIDVTSKIVWDKIAAGTKATGKVTVGGVERTVEVNGLTIFEPVNGSLVVTGVKTQYLAGEKFSSTISKVTIQMVAGNNPTNTKEKELTQTEYNVAPDALSVDVTEVTVSMVGYPDVKHTYTISVIEATFVATNRIQVGDTITFGTSLGYSEGYITGGYEIALKEDGSLGASSFGYLPMPEMSFTVCEGVSAGTYSFKYGNRYLRSNGKSLDFGDESAETSSKNNNLYEFYYPYYFPGESHDGQPHNIKLVEVEEDSLCFEADPLINPLDYQGGERVELEAVIVGNEILISFTYYESYYDETPTEYDETYTCIKSGGGFKIIYSSDSPLGQDNSFTVEYVESQNSYVDDYWLVKPLKEDKQIYYNSSANKFGVGSNVESNLMLFRNNDLPFEHQVTGLTVSVPEEISTTVKKGEEFNWLGIKVKATYQGESKARSVPLGGYEVTLPDTSTYGTKQVIVTYGPKGNKKTASFNINVIGDSPNLMIKQTYSSGIWVGDTDINLSLVYPPKEDEPVTWSSSNENLATIDQNGHITPLKAGSVTFTVTSFDGYYSTSLTIEVKQRPTGLSLPVTELTMKLNEEYQIHPIITPEDATNKECNYLSSDPEIVSVSAEGKLKALKAGNATITVKTKGKGTGESEPYSATIQVTVLGEEFIHATALSLNKDIVSLTVGNTEQLIATISPEDCDVKQVEWSSSNSSVASVDANGLITALKAGTTTITATADGLTATCTVSVSDVAIESLSFVETEISDLEVGANVTLHLNVTPANASLKNVIWKSSDTSVATVRNGTVKGVKEGTATITATLGGKVASIDVTVVAAKAEENTDQNLASDEEVRQAIIVVSAIGGTTVAGAGAGIGIPLSIRAKKRKLLKK